MQRSDVGIAEIISDRILTASKHSSMTASTGNTSASPGRTLCAGRSKTIVHTAARRCSGRNSGRRSGFASSAGRGPRAASARIAESRWKWARSSIAACREATNAGGRVAGTLGRIVLVQLFNFGDRAENMSNQPNDFPRGKSTIFEMLLGSTLIQDGILGLRKWGREPSIYFPVLPFGKNLANRLHRGVFQT